MLPVCLGTTSALILQVANQLAEYANLSNLCLGRSLTKGQFMPRECKCLPFFSNALY